MNTELIPATQAKAIIDQGKSQRDIENLFNVTMLINRAISKSQSSVYVDMLTDNTKSKLKELGYEISSHPDRDGSTDYTISWK